MALRFSNKTLLAQKGGKALALDKVRSSGVLVPEFRTLFAKHFESFCDNHDINTRFLTTLELSGDAQTKALGEIQSDVRSLPLSKMTQDVLLAIAEEFQGVLLAIRSSATAEDGQEDSFAGIFTSVLNVNTKDIEEAVRECWASVFTKELLTYRELKGNSKIPQMAVILQRMVQFERSGVLFTRNPVELDKETMVLEAVEGLSEKLVSGDVEGERHVLERNGEHAASTSVEKTDAGIVGKKLRETLYDIGKKLERVFGSPQDIEWGELSGVVYVVQSRPITALDTIEDFRIWDNANIVENYGGITLPLTFSVMQNAYHHVYVQFCRVMGVSRKRILLLDPSLRQMLGHIRGHVYYNLLNWYRLIGILPMFQSNSLFMERMMGTRAKLPDAVDMQLRCEIQVESKSHLRALWTGISFIFYHLTSKLLVRRFLHWFDSEYASFRGLPFTTMTAEELLEAYEDAEEVFLANWRAPIINDFLVMVHHGLFRSLTEKWLPKGERALVNELIRSGYELRSLEPTKQIIAIARSINENKALAKRITLEMNATELKELLSEPNSPNKIQELVHEYLQRFFFRTIDEMKLEQEDMTVDDSYLYQCILGYIRSGKDAGSYTLKEASASVTIRSLKEDLPVIRRIILEWSLKHTKRALRNREDTRFARSELFGVLRILFRQLGDRFVDKGWLDVGEGIYFLTLDEVLDIVHTNNSSSKDLITLTNKRRDLYAIYSNESLPDRFETRTKNVDVETSAYLESTSDIQPKSALKGTACSSGIAEGTILVVRSVKDVSFDGETILVAERTDPGWTPLFAAANGLIVERGGLLSHAAIVAREFGLPAVIGVRDATKILKSGMRVRVNGSAGTVEILNDTGVDGA